MRLRLLFSLACAIAGGAAIAADITDAKLRAAQDSGAWLMYGRNYAAWRYSELSEVNAANVSKLSPRWIFQTGASSLETTPLVFDGLMFATGADNRAFALDLLTGRAV